MLRTGLRGETRHPATGAAQQPGLLFGNLQSTLGMDVGLRENRGGSRIQTWNRYAYVSNNPMSNVDTLGLFCGPGSVADENSETGCSPVAQPLPADPTSGCWDGVCGPIYTGYKIIVGVGGGGGGNGNPQTQPIPLLNQTLGMRAPDQSFNDCMKANAGKYSLLGVIDLLGFMFLRP